MSNIVTLKSFPFDSVKQLNEESGQMEDDRLYAAEIFRKYFAKFLSNGVYYGHYKNYGENSMKVSLDTGLTIKVSKGTGIIEGADYELENDTLFALERPATGTRKDRVIVKFDNTLGTRETQLYIKQGNETTPATLQRDENIYEICIAEVTVKSTSNLVDTDIIDTRLDKNLCGIVDSLVSVDGKEMYEKFQQYIDTVTENLVRKDQDSVIEGKLTVKNGVVGNADTATKLKNTIKVYLRGAAITKLPEFFDGSKDLSIFVTDIDPDHLLKPVPTTKGGTGLDNIDNKEIECLKVDNVTGNIKLMYNPLTKICCLNINATTALIDAKIIGNVPSLYRPKDEVWGIFEKGKISINSAGQVKAIPMEEKQDSGDELLPIPPSSMFNSIYTQVVWFL